MKIEDNRPKPKYVWFDDIEPGTVFKCEYDLTDSLYLKLSSSNTEYNTVDLTDNQIITFANVHVNIIKVKVVIE